MVIIKHVVVLYALMCFFKTSVMTKLKTSLSPESKAAAPKWIEVKVSDMYHALLLSTYVM